MLTAVTDELLRRLRHARQVTVLPGAGISAESGVPTFRGGGGAAVWRGWPAERLSSVEMLQQNPKLLWEWFEYRRGVIKPLRPNAAHLALASCERQLEEFHLITKPPQVLPSMSWLLARIRSRAEKSLPLA